MPRSAGAVVQNNFTNGLITEATALNFPENAVTDTLNCVFDERSIVSRRRGIDLEIDYVERVVTETGIISTFLWQDAGGAGDLSFVVKQIGSKIRFYEVSSAGPVSQGLKSFSIDLEDFKVTGAPDTSNIQCQFTFGNGFLFVSHPNCEPFYVEYDEDTDDIETALINIMVRDTEGLEPPFATDTRPIASVVTTEHHYNILNQGWNEGYISGFNADLEVWPSNSDVWWLFKDSEESFTPRKTDDWATRGNSPAPRGRFIGNPFNYDYSHIAGVSPLPVRTSGTARPATVTFFAGRVFYSGVWAPRFNSRIYFSKTIESTRDFGQCYQTNDPTSEAAFDLLKTDGGVISIPEAGRIISLFPIDGSLIVFATNGIWTITGSTGAGFQADDYSIRKISTVSTLSPSSFVNAGGLPVWWNADGIYTLEVEQSIGTVQVKSIVDQKIKTFYNNIPASNKAFAKGEFDTLTRTIHWLYNSEPVDTTEEQYAYNSVLCLNVLSGAFYPWRVNSANVKLRDLVTVKGIGRTFFDVQVVDNSGVGVVDELGVAVTVRDSDDRQLDSIFKYLVSYQKSGNTVYTWAEARDETFVDYLSFDSVGVNFSSYFTTGFLVHGDAQRKFQVNYMYVYTKNDILQSTFNIKTLWDYATSADTNRWSAPQLITMLPMPYSSDVRRIKMRGHGKACQFRVDSVDGKPFDITGWSLFETVNTGV